MSDIQNIHEYNEFLQKSFEFYLTNRRVSETLSIYSEIILLSPKYFLIRKIEFSKHYYY